MNWFTLRIIKVVIAVFCKAPRACIEVVMSSFVIARLYFDCSDEAALHLTLPQTSIYVLVLSKVWICESDGFPELHASLSSLSASQAMQLCSGGVFSGYYYNAWCNDYFSK